MLPGGRLVRWGALAVGCAIVAVGFLADRLGAGGSPGIGLRQSALILAGVLLVAASITSRAAGRRLFGPFLAWARDASDAIGARRIVVFALTLGLLTGLLETLILAVIRFAFGSFVRHGPQVAWMVPLLDALVLVVIGGALWLVGRVWKKLTTPQVVAFVLLVVVLDTLLHRMPGHGRLATPAQWILVVAVASVLVRRIAGPLGAGGPWLTRSAAAVAAIVVVLGGATALWPGLMERRTYRMALPAGENRASVLVIILDTVRAASLSLYGYERPTTPELRRFAAGGVVFDRAIAPSSWTLPTHATVFTGRYLGELDVDWLTPLDGHYPTIAGLLTRAGFATAGFSANTGYVSHESGLARGFAHFEDFEATPGEMVRSNVMLRQLFERLGFGELVHVDVRGRRTAADINGAFLEWLDRRRPASRPFFAFLNYYDAHAPYDAPPPFDSLFDGPLGAPLRPAGPNLGKREIARWRDQYDRSIAWIDAQLGVLFRELEQRGMLDSITVIVSSDHGEHFGEHRFMGHATTLYDPVLHVPLVVRGPGVPAGVRVRERAALRDIAATVLDLSNVEHDGRVPGRSLVRYWRGQGEGEPIYSELGRGLRIAPHYPNARSDLWSAYDADLHYIVSSSGEEELYRVGADSLELDNLAPAAKELPRLRELIARHRAAVGAGRPE
jgi:arylsulfatase A-like enzyme